MCGEVSPVMQEGLKATEDHPLVGNARGVGLIAGVELMADKQTRTPFPAEAKAGALVERKCHEAGLVVRAIGDRVAFTPPLIMTEDNLREMVDPVPPGAGRRLGGTDVSGACTNRRRSGARVAPPMKRPLWFASRSLTGGSRPASSSASPRSWRCLPRLCP